VWDLLVVMAKSNLEEDIFNGLKQRGIELNTHVENIFRFTGYNNARTRFRQFQLRNRCARNRRMCALHFEKKGTSCQDGLPEENGDFRRVARR
jgi:hypothetical protein